MSLLIFHVWTATVLTFFKNGLELFKEKSLKMIPKYGELRHKVGLRVAGKKIREIALHFN